MQKRLSTIWSEQASKITQNEKIHEYIEKIDPISGYHAKNKNYVDKEIYLT